MRSVGEAGAGGVGAGNTSVASSLWCEQNRLLLVPKKRLWNIVARPERYADDLMQSTGNSLIVS